MVAKVQGDFLLKHNAGMPIQGKKAVGWPMNGHRKGCCYMANKYIFKILSVSALILTIVLFATVNRTEAQFTPTMKTFTISGSTGLDGVTMTGLPRPT